MLAFIALAIFITGCDQPGEPAPRSIPEQIDQILEKSADRDGPGCILAVIEHGKFTYNKAIGLADIDTNKPITADTPFDVTALSRQFTGASVTFLITNGAVMLDDNIRVFFPEMPKAEPPVTIQTLFYHTSGIADYIDVMKNAGLENASDDLQILDLLAEEKLQFPADTKFSPNRSSYFMLAYVVQRVTSSPVANWSDRLIFVPLNMTNTVFCDHPENKTTNKALGYVKTSNGKYRKSPIKNATIAGDTGLHTTINDLLKWEKALYTTEFGGENFHKLMNTTHTLTDGTNIDYAFGMNITTRQGLRTLNANSATAGFSAAMIRIPEKKLTVICLSNLEGTDTQAIVSKVTDICLSGK